MSCSVGDIYGVNLGATDYYNISLQVEKHFPKQFSITLYTNPNLNSNWVDSELNTQFDYKKVHMGNSVIVYEVSCTM